MEIVPTNPIVSIIIPVYNTENYLNRCLDSIVKQSYPYIEIIIINDGSTDNSVQICEDYLKKDNRIKVFQKENGGVSSARNIGLENATGDWLCFLDSDDYLDLNGIEHLVNLTSKYQEVDLIRSYHHTHKQSNNITNKDPSLYSRDEFLKSNKIGGFISSLFVKQQIVTDNNLNFSTELKIKEDLVFTFKCVLNCNLILENHQSYYNYMIHEVSATKTVNFEKIKNSLRAAELVYEYSLNYDNNIVRASVNRYLNNGLQGFIDGISRFSAQDNTIKPKIVRKIILNYLTKNHLIIHTLNKRNSLFTIITLVDFRILALIRKIFNK